MKTASRKIVFSSQKAEPLNEVIGEYKLIVPRLLDLVHKRNAAGDHVVHEQKVLIDVGYMVLNMKDGKTAADMPLLTDVRLVQFGLQSQEQILDTSKNSGENVCFLGCVKNTQIDPSTGKLLPRIILENQIGRKNIFVLNKTNLDVSSEFVLYFQGGRGNEQTEFLNYYNIDVFLEVAFADN